MYRVELKDKILSVVLIYFKLVPNVPCGVESNSSALKASRVFSFLMYRVELKDYVLLFPYTDWDYHVPNVPCGVESRKGGHRNRLHFQKFLMYRVELKALLKKHNLLSYRSLWFLMYRVELKECFGFAWLHLLFKFRS